MNPAKHLHPFIAISHWLLYPYLDKIQNSQEIIIISIYQISEQQFSCVLIGSRN